MGWDGMEDNGRHGETMEGQWKAWDGQAWKDEAVER